MVGRPPLAVAVNIKRLKTARTAILVILGLALIVAGIWTAAAYYLGAIPGAGIGLALSGVALLVIEGLSE
jgi:predicted phage tail protein